MGLKEVPPLSSPDTTTTGKACHRKPPLLVLLELRNGFERWRLGGATSNRRHYVHHRVNNEALSSTEERRRRTLRSAFER
ncbi:unnamed protein product [Brassica rapa]|uniref:Uncharacterized protein n=1 Tax=Brassica campestris TaxID=3711 RepID=A0A3P5ZSE5_BRACM|nr:unnamed protein product [Brassica rapa]CAG7884349.1 unnamed protein product [Brassica rapa]VDC83132.1 unnamed protein product [Brassica rapa]VDC83424.1 unnamed protein product [Brassica rapa]